jgi:hypothetical protein
MIGPAPWYENSKDLCCDLQHILFCFAPKTTETNRAAAASQHGARWQQQSDVWWQLRPADQFTAMKCKKHHVSAGTAANVKISFRAVTQATDEPLQ